MYSYPVAVIPDEQITRFVYTIAIYKEQYFPNCYHFEYNLDDCVFDSYLMAYFETTKIFGKNNSGYECDKRIAIINCVPIDSYEDSNATKIAKNRLVLDMFMFDALTMEGRRHLQLLMNECQFCNQLGHNEPPNCAITNHIQTAFRSIRANELHQLFGAICSEDRNGEYDRDIDNIRYVEEYLIREETQTCFNEAIVRYIKKHNINMCNDKIIYNGNCNLPAYHYD